MWTRFDTCWRTAPVTYPCNGKGRWPLRNSNRLSRQATPAERQNDLDDLFPVVELPSKPWMPRKHGKSVHRSTAIRWALYHTPRLKSIMAGGTRVTCRRWVSEFFEACSGGAALPNPITDRRRQADRDAASAELDLIGIK